MYLQVPQTHPDPYASEGLGTIEWDLIIFRFFSRKATGEEPSVPHMFEKLHKSIKTKEWISAFANETLERVEEAASKQTNTSLLADPTQAETWWKGPLGQHMSNNPLAHVHIEIGLTKGMIFKLFKKIDKQSKKYKKDCEKDQLKKKSKSEFKKGRHVAEESDEDDDEGEDEDEEESPEEFDDSSSSDD
ncbi:hypothetical protein CDL15_Pgr015077 [Punica granatum]|uniref:Uncharacterized protein n=1 Tax=Punica granatum TaxID=22663 RepID=A0A218X098_PUNGR|nr:hypothetical protein CDL15_Pgr015077 [Punica granatum]